MRKSIIAPLLAIAMSGSATADETWTLQRCVDYALENNLTVKNSHLQVDQSEIDVTSAKDAFLPTLSASASEGFNFGRGLTSDNTYADRNTSSFQWGVNMSLPLFQGLSDVRQLKVAKSAMQQYLMEFEAAKDDLTLNIMAQYLQVLYNKEVAKSAISQLSYSTYEVERQKALVDEGKVAEAYLYDAEAQQAQDRLQVITAENDVRVALVNLANLLQLPTADGFDVAPLDEENPEIPGPDVVYSRALEHNHSILSARQGIVTARDRVSYARSGYMPRLSFDASVGSSYYTVAGYDNQPFATQMRNNFSTYLGLRLSIPIFDAFSTRNNIRRARLQETSARLELDRRESELYKTIQLAYTQATGARDKFLTSSETLDKTRLSFEATRERYALGRATPTDFEQAKNNLFRVEISRISSRYEYLLRYRILRFYETNRL
ncbi:MAG: TolC family protein [Muribaculaceae bacterium]